MRRTIKRTPKTRRRRCVSGKTRYRDHASAVTALRRLAGSKRQVNVVRCYQCGHCAGWHLTSQAVQG